VHRREASGSVRNIEKELIFRARCDIIEHMFDDEERPETSPDSTNPDSTSPDSTDQPGFDQPGFADGGGFDRPDR
jgi:hypothetical protein